MGVAECYTQTNDLHDNVKFNGEKLYFDVPTSVNNTKFSCIEVLPNGYIQEDGSVSQSTHMYAGVNNGCDDNSLVHLNNLPTSLVYDPTATSANASPIRSVTDGTAQCLILNTTVSEPFVYSDSRYSNKLKTIFPRWEFTLESRLKAGDYVLTTLDNGELALDSATSGDTVFQHWSYDKSHLRNIGKNMCINPRLTKPSLVPCDSQVSPTLWEYTNKNQFRHKLTGQCLDGDGTNVYLWNSCVEGNPYQTWYVLNSGNKIKHKASGKCLKANVTSAGVGFGFKTCTCDTPVSDTEYTSYVDSKTKGCSTISNWGYDGEDPSCINYIFESDKLMDKFLTWCDTNKGNDPINKLCMSSMRAGTLLSYYSRSCNTGADVLTKKVCTELLNTNMTSVDEKTRDYMRIKYDDALESYCADKMVIKEGEVSTKSRLYTTNWEDSRCLGNWVYQKKDGSKQTVKLVSNIEDTNFWCLKASGADDPLYNCYIASGFATIYSTDGYIAYNKLWRDEGARRSLPIRLYKLLALKFSASATRDADIIAYIRSTYKSTTSIHPADALLFYNGYPLFTSDNSDPSFKVYSENGQYKLYFTSGLLTRETTSTKTIVFQSSIAEMTTSRFNIVDNEGNVCVINMSGNITVIPMVADTTKSVAFQDMSTSWLALGARTALTDSVFRAITSVNVGKSSDNIRNYINSTYALSGNTTNIAAFFGGNPLLPNAKGTSTRVRNLANTFAIGYGDGIIIRIKLINGVESSSSSDILWSPTSFSDTKYTVVDAGGNVFNVSSTGVATQHTGMDVRYGFENRVIDENNSKVFLFFLLLICFAICIYVYPSCIRACFERVKAWRSSSASSSPTS